MNLKEIEQLIELAKKTNISELKFENKDFKVSVTLPSVSFGENGRGNFHPQMHIAPNHQVQFLNNQNVVSGSQALTPSSSNANSQTDTKSFHSIKSPFVGTFYSSPSPDKPTYVRIGDKIQKGQVLCILEAMKIMNEIESDISGEVVEVCVENEGLVEYGQVLFKLKI